MGLNVGDKQFTLVGEEQGENPFSGTTLSSNRRGYYAFDTSGLSLEVASATFRVWGWAENGGPESVQGAFHSPQSSETLQLYALDNHTADAVISAPYNDIQIHSIDVPIWEDLGDGAVYGSRVFTGADEMAPGLIPSPLSTTTDCSAPSSGDACGRWLDFVLNSDALEAINSRSGDFIFGASISTIDKTFEEQLLAGAPVDLSNPNVLDFKQPAPQLLLTAVPVPAAVWLFGSALVGLVGAKRRKSL